MAGAIKTGLASMAQKNLGRKPSRGKRTLPQHVMATSVLTLQPLLLGFSSQASSLVLAGAAEEPKPKHTPIRRISHNAVGPAADPPPPITRSNSRSSGKLWTPKKLMRRSQRGENHDVLMQSMQQANPTPEEKHVSTPRPNM